MRFPLLLLLCVFQFLSIGQKIETPKNRIPVQHPDFFAWVEVYEGDVKENSIENDRFYYWLKAKQIHSSKGGYHGELLHGQYTALYKTDALKEKGKYNKGLKAGQWKEWHPNGELKCISYWKNGRQAGRFSYYNEWGKITYIKNYRKGLLHGRQTSFSDSSATITKFRRGEPLIKKQKKKKEKIQVQKAKEITTNNDSLTGEPSVPKKSLIRFKNKNNTGIQTENNPQKTQQKKKTEKVAKKTGRPEDKNE